MADAPSFPNRILIEVDAGTAADAANAAVEAVTSEWRDIAAAVHGPSSDALSPVLDTFPDIRWVAWEPPEGSDADFRHAWNVVTEAAVARKRVRSFGRLIAYDVADDARQVRVADELLDLGASRLQRSVFWLLTDEAGLVRMRVALRSVIDEEADRVHWYRTCSNCPGIGGHTRAAKLPSVAAGSGPWIV